MSTIVRLPIQREAYRQPQTLTLIAAETVTSTAVHEALGAPLIHATNRRRGIHGGHTSAGHA